MNQTTIETQPQLGDSPLFSHRLADIPWLVHGVTHRVAGMGKADGNVGFSGARDREDAWQMRQIWCDRIGVDAGQLVVTGQVHGNDVHEVTPDQRGVGASPDRPQEHLADATMTDVPGLALFSLNADCLPILFVDPTHRAIAAAHAGWRGTVADIAGETVRAMTGRYGSDPSGLLVFFGAAIGGCCCEVGDDVTDAWRVQAHDLGDDAERAIRQGPRKEHFDGAMANRLLLQRAGVRDENIEDPAICTMCRTDEWFSHRGHGPTAGRQAAIIMIRNNVPS